MLISIHFCTFPWSQCGSRMNALSSILTGRQGGTSGRGRAAHSDQPHSLYRPGLNQKPGPQESCIHLARQRKVNIQTKHKKHLQDFPGGPVVKNLSANAADTGSISSPGVLHVLHSNQSYALLLPLLSHFGRVRPCVTPWTAASQAPLSMGVSRQEYWSGLPCPPPGDLPDPGAESTSLMSPALAGEFFITSATWEAHPT